MKETETEKFLKKYETDKKNGLIDIKFSTEDVSHSTVESFFEEVNRAENEENIPDKEIF